MKYFVAIVFLGLIVTKLFLREPQPQETVTIEPKHIEIQKTEVDSKIEKPLLKSPIDEKKVEANLEEAMNTANQTLKTEPQNQKALRAMALGYYVKTLQSEGNERLDNLKEAQYWIERSQEVLKHDKNFEEITLGAKLESQDNAEKVKYLNDLHRQKPDSGLAAYFLAVQAYKGKNFNESITWLEEAIQREPQNERLVTTLNNLKKNNQQNPFYLDFEAFSG